MAVACKALAHKLARASYDVTRDRTRFRLRCNQKWRATEKLGQGFPFVIVCFPCWRGESLSGSLTQGGARNKHSLCPGLNYSGLSGQAFEAPPLSATFNCTLSSGTHGLISVSLLSLWLQLNEC